MTLHLIVNDTAKTAIVIGRGIKTKEIDLTNTMTHFDVLPQRLLDIEKSLAGLSLTDGLPLHSTAAPMSVNPEIVMQQCSKLSKHVYANACRRVIPFYDTIRNKPEERGDTAGEFFGNPLDDGLASPNIELYRVVAAHGLPRGVVGHLVRNVCDSRDDWSQKRVEFVEQRNQRMWRVNLVSLYMGIPDNEFNFNEMVALVRMGAKMRALSWPFDEAVFMDDSEGRNMMVHARLINGKWEQTMRCHFGFDELDAQWIVVEI